MNDLAPMKNLLVGGGGCKVGQISSRGIPDIGKSSYYHNIQLQIQLQYFNVLLTYKWPNSGVSDEHVSSVLQCTIHRQCRSKSQQVSHQGVYIYRVEWRDSIVPLDVGSSGVEDWFHRQESVVIAMRSLAWVLPTQVLNTKEILYLN